MRRSDLASANVEGMREEVFVVKMVRDVQNHCAGFPSMQRMLKRLMLLTTDNCAS
jgi:hypothetical protein